MKKILFLFLIFILFIFAACGTFSGYSMKDYNNPKNIIGTLDYYDEKTTLQEALQALGEQTYSNFSDAGRNTYTWESLKMPQHWVVRMYSDDGTRHTLGNYPDC